MNHERTEEELEKEFPDGWHNLEDDIYRELMYIPAKFKVLEHHVKVYAGNIIGYKINDNYNVSSFDTLLVR